MAITYSPSDVAAAMRRAGFSETAIPTGIAVATAESGRRTVQSNIVTNGKREGSYGVWQINDFWLGPNSLMAPLTIGCTYDLDCSTKAAFAISRGGSDWSPWSAFTSGSYLNFLNLSPTPPPSSGSVGPVGSVGPSSPASPSVSSSFAAAPAAAPTVPTLASRLSGSGLFSIPLLGGLVQVGTKSVITIALIGVIFVGMVKVAGGNPAAVAKDVAKVAK